MQTLLAIFLLGLVFPTVCLVEKPPDPGLGLSDSDNSQWWRSLNADKWFSSNEAETEKDVNHGGLVAMAQLAAAVYDPETRKVEGWELKKSWNMAADGGTDWAVIYGNKHKMCALAFSGSNDKGDWGNNGDGLVTRSWKGVSDDAHRGFVREADRFLGKQFRQFKTTLQSKACRSGVIVIGHSLGGGIAALIAALANKHRYFNAKFLYTFGAPGPTKTQLRNPANSGSCFNGARVYNKDGYSGDPVPPLSRKGGYVYPRMAALRLRTSGTDRKSFVYDCTSQEARNEPYHSGVLLGAGAMTHKMVAYVTRLQKTIIKDIGCLQPKKDRPKCPGEEEGEGEKEEKEEKSSWWR